jgi:hypothetical protein
VYSAALGSLAAGEGAADDDAAVAVSLHDPAAGEADGAADDEAAGAGDEDGGAVVAVGAAGVEGAAVPADGVGVVVPQDAANATATSASRTRDRWREAIMARMMPRPVPRAERDGMFLS